MGKDKGKQREQASFEQYQKDMSASREIDPLEKARRDEVSALHAWYMGKDASGNAQPIDVLKMPGSGVDISLFNQAKQDADAGRVGRGFDYNAGGDNGNAYAAQLADERQRDRNTAAGGALENRVAQRLGGLDDSMLSLANMNYSRKFGIADRSRQGYQDQVNRPKTNPWWQQMIMGAVPIAGSLATGGVSSMLGGAKAAKTVADFGGGMAGGAAAGSAF